MAARLLLASAILLLLASCANADGANGSESEAAEVTGLSPLDLACEALATEIDRLALEFGGTLGIAVVAYDGAQ